MGGAVAVTGWGGVGRIGVRASVLAGAVAAVGGAGDRAAEGAWVWEGAWTAPDAIGSGFLSVTGSNSMV